MLDAFTCRSSMTFGLRGGWPGIQSRLSLYEGKVNNGRYVTLRGASSFPSHYTTGWKQQLITDSSGAKRQATATEDDFEALFGLWTDGLSAHIQTLSQEQKAATQQARADARREIVVVECDAQTPVWLKKFLFMMKAEVDKL
ncbi:hypothetical protein TrRE_jg2609 [Triparma retinervis]|uniref:Uncharacterized protein n=1 Tax=Triparma retinervis TaxID=2557542 RepID=A0A9W6ZC20_9STRA|nr:hypothetical protein TrRE_jg2609 [Triparma retinervis]